VISVTAGVVFDRAGMGYCAGADPEVSMTSVVEWLQQQVTESLPIEGLAGAEIKRRVKALAEAAVAVRAGDGTAFGMHLDEGARQACEPVLAELEGALETWRSHLGDRAGDKGRRVVEELVAAYGVRLGDGAHSSGASH
jgi:hypothetical protein